MERFLTLVLALIMVGVVAGTVIIPAFDAVKAATATPLIDVAKLAKVR
jgi:hypothetical protein